MTKILNNNTPTTAENLPERFWDKVLFEPHGCWEWRGARRFGYGQVRIDRKTRSAHRVAYELEVGPIPEGLSLDHLCRNRACVNPSHLEPVTLRENVLRGEGPTAENARKTHCHKGHPLSGDNLYIRPSSGSRLCRTCHPNFAYGKER